MHKRIVVGIASPAATGIVERNRPYNAEPLAFLDNVDTCLRIERFDSQKLAIERKATIFWNPSSCMKPSPIACRRPVHIARKWPSDFKISSARFVDSGIYRPIIGPAAKVPSISKKK